MHNIPSFVLLAVLIVAWKWEKVGGIILTIIGLAFSIFIFVFNYKRNHFPVMTCLLGTLALAIPFVLAGILFILNYYRKKKELSGVQ
jgi:prolipoprotein diacylglyceryltransferase